MRLHTVAEIPFPRPVVYAAWRDRLRDLLPHLPNVRAIEVVSRADEGDVVRLVNVWTSRAEIPAVARSVVTPAMLSWTDHATWDARAFTTAWRTEVAALREAVRAEGVNRFEAPTDAATRLVIDGGIAIDARRVPGVPRFAAGAVGPVVERFVVERVRSNLAEIARGLTELLRAG